MCYLMCDIVPCDRNPVHVTRTMNIIYISSGCKIVLKKNSRMGSIPHIVLPLPSPRKYATGVIGTKRFFFP